MNTTPNDSSATVHPINRMRSTSAASSGGRPTAPVRKRRHAARKTRVAAAALSLTATGLLTQAFAAAEHAQAATSSSTATATKTYTGSVATNKWGSTQVQVTVSVGKITNVTALQLPNSKPKSARLSTNAATVLKVKVISAQSASVTTVSGATMTSRSYLESLQSAIDTARAAGQIA
jgi:uncharacterized protein with FMN-binding domain